ncbi:FAD-dependent oxidoreductase [Bacillus suaedaesalsae]|uniref:FAD-dependent oxidoreductase n=1 Tax=Bacillus suaedaesalsae TaxID=2810349 RepID=A0ABS2DML5_9BACI|nr:FAD-dependent oxidoreductase [Bacillus suaedaesalsae]
MKVNVLIVGGGPAGISASIWCKRLDISHLLIEKDSQLGGQLSQIKNKIMDYPGFYGLTGSELLEHFFTHLNDIKSNYLCNTEIKIFDIEKKHMTIMTKGGEIQVQFDYVIFATGASLRTLGVPGEEEMVKRGEVYSASKDHHLFVNKKVAIIGGGDRAFEGALLLANAGAYVTLIHRSTMFRARKEYIVPVQEHPRISLLVNTEVLKISGENETRGIIVQSKGSNPYQLDTDAVLVRVGIQPNSEQIKGIVLTNREGYVITDEYGKTSHDNIYAIGDLCNKPEYTSISTSVGQGMVTTKNISLLLEKQV